jgi:hypothetical protein
MAVDLRCRPALDKDPGAIGYEAFWRRYLAAHADRRTRALHYVGSLAGLGGLAAAAALFDWRPLVAAPLVGYGCAWFGHYVFEKNRPETFGHPAWSLVSDFRMLYLFVSGRLGDELRRSQ